MLRLNLKKRGERWRLDYNKDGLLAKDFTPHGAAAVVRDKKGKIRFPVYQGWHLHEDVGERLKLVRKRTTAQFQALPVNLDSEPHLADLGLTDLHKTGASETSAPHNTVFQKTANSHRECA